MKQKNMISFQQFRIAALMLLYVLSLPVLLHGQTLTTDIVTTCNVPSVGVTVSKSGNAYTVAVSNLNGRTVQSILCWVGTKTGNGTLATESNGSYTFTPNGNGTLYVDVTINIGGRLLIYKNGATVNVYASGVDVGNHDNQLIGPNEHITVTATDVTENPKVEVLGLSGSSADGTLSLSPVSGATGTFKSVTFDMPISDVTIIVNTRTTAATTDQKPGKEDPAVKVPTATTPAAGSDPTAENGKDYTYDLITTLVTDADELSKVQDALDDLYKEKPEGDLTIPIHITMPRQEMGTADDPVNVEKLNQPVWITLPYPEGVTKNDGICILHILSDGSVERIIPTKLDNNITFPVTSFGTFVWDITKLTGKPFAGIKITPASVTLEKGKSLQLTVSYTDASGKAVTPNTADRILFYESSDPSVATVSTEGLITAIADGTATITATSLFATDTPTATCVVTVETPEEPVPPVETWYVLTIPADSRLTTNIAVGQNSYREGTEVKLTLTPINGAKLSLLTVYANNQILTAGADGSYTIVMNRYVDISFRWNEEVAAETIETTAPTAYGTNGTLIVNRPKAVAAAVYTTGGACITRLDPQSGTLRMPLGRGLYIVTFASGERFKLRIR